MRNHIYIIISVFVWGASQLLLDKLYASNSPLLIIFLRFFLAGSLILIVNRKNIRGQFKWIYLLTGFLGCLSYYTFSAYAIQLSSVPFVAIMGGLMPIVALILDLFLEKNPVNLEGKLAIIASIIGITLFSFQAEFKISLLAGLLMIIANLSWLIYLYVRRKYHVEENSTVLGIECLAAGLMILPILLVKDIHMTFDFFSITGVLFITLISTVMSYYLYIIGSKNLSLSVASIYLNLMPVVSILLSAIIYQTKLIPSQYLGMILVFFSTVIIQDFNGIRKAKNI